MMNLWQLGSYGPCGHYYASFSERLARNMQARPWSYVLILALLEAMHVSACTTSWLCLFLISTSSHDELAVFDSISQVQP